MAYIFFLSDAARLAYFDRWTHPLIGLERKVLLDVNKIKKRSVSSMEGFSYTVSRLGDFLIARKESRKP